MKRDHKDVLVLIIRLATGVVLLFSAMAKLQAPTESISFLVHLHVPAVLGSYVILATCGVELFLGLLCISGIYAGIALRATGVLFAVFGLVLLLAILGGVKGSCGCFGSAISGEISALSIARDFSVGMISYYAGTQRSYLLALSNLVGKYSDDDVTTQPR